MEEKLKVSDLVPLTEQDYMETKNILKNLRELSNEYYDMSDLYDPNQLEIIKRKFDRELQNLATYFAKIKKFKGGTHTYLDEVRKRIKGEAIQMLLDDGSKVTSAESLVYSTKYYKDRVALMENIKEFMIKTELLYERYEYTFNAIIQSLSAARREFENNKK